MRLALILPPLTQLNAPYPATAYLARALRQAGRTCTQRDLGLELVLRIFSRAGLAEVFDALEGQDDLPPPAARALALRARHEAVIDPVVAFLQGRDRTLAPRLLAGPFLPETPRLAAADLDGFGPLSTDDAARHLATRYLADLADLVTSCVDDGFGLARYHHHLAVGLASFDPLAERLARTTLVDRHLDALADTVDADAVGLTVPFPGNLYGALRIGRRLRARGVRVWMGGGYVNTELRDVDEPRLWDFVDALTYDDGEGPLLALLQHAEGGPDRRHRTRTRDGLHQAAAPDVPAAFAADYGDLRLDGYLQLVDSVNPAHRLWSDGRWNKITLAHGCYWKRCSFCDIELDYISRFAPARAGALADAMEELVAATGQRGFHFVDEAAPPRTMRDLALELLARGTVATWWGNIRFERAFTPDLCRLLAAAGLVMVTGGLEVASDRLLARMEKGVTVAQVARAARAFRCAGVGVHAYLMYGFPTETEHETVDSLEVVRQLFAAGAIDSAFWHRFVLTRHSGIARDPAAYGVVVPPRPVGFAANDLAHLDPSGADHDRFDEPLAAALAAWMRGRELDRRDWIPGAPETTVPEDLVARALAEAPEPEGERLVWLGGDPMDEDGALVAHATVGRARIPGGVEADWVAEVLMAARPGQPPLRAEDAIAAFPGDWRRFQKRWARLREVGLLRI